MAVPAQSKYTTYFLDTLRSESKDFQSVLLKNDTATSNQASSLRIKIPNDEAGVYGYNGLGILRFEVTSGICDVDQRHMKSAAEPFHFTINEKPRSDYQTFGATTAAEATPIGVRLPNFRFVESSPYGRAMADQGTLQASFLPAYGDSKTAPTPSAPGTAPNNNAACYNDVTPDVTFSVFTTNESNYPYSDIPSMNALDALAARQEMAFHLSELAVSMHDPVWRRWAAPFANACEAMVKGMLGTSTTTADGKAAAAFRRVNSVYTPSAANIFIAQDPLAVPEHRAVYNHRRMPAQLASRQMRYAIYVDPLTHKLTIETENQGQFEIASAGQLDTLPSVPGERFQPGFDFQRNVTTSGDVSFTFHNRMLAAMLGLDVGTDATVNSFTVSTTTVRVPTALEGKERLKTGFASALPGSSGTDGKDHDPATLPYWYRGYWQAPNPINPTLGRLLYLHLDGSNLSFRSGKETFDDSIHQIYYSPVGSNEDVQPYRWENNQPIAFYPLPFQDHVELSLRDADGNIVPMNGAHIRAHLLLRKGLRQA